MNSKIRGLLFRKSPSQGNAKTPADVAAGADGGAVVAAWNWGTQPEDVKVIMSCIKELVPEIGKKTQDADYKPNQHFKKNISVFDELGDNLIPLETYSKNKIPGKDGAVIASSEEATILFQKIACDLATKLDAGGFAPFQLVDRGDHFTLAIRDVQTFPVIQSIEQMARERDDELMHAPSLADYGEYSATKPLVARGRAEAAPVSAEDHRYVYYEDKDGREGHDAAAYVNKTGDKAFEGDAAAKRVIKDILAGGKRNHPTTPTPNATPSGSPKPQPKAQRSSSGDVHGDAVSVEEKISKYNADMVEGWKKRQPVPRPR